MLTFNSPSERTPVTSRELPFPESVSGSRRWSIALVPGLKDSSSAGDEFDIKSTNQDHTKLIWLDILSC